MNILRSNLPELPERMKSRPVDKRGFPVPWFVEWAKNNVPCPEGQGEPEFRAMSYEKHVRAIREQLCWTCGQKHAGNDYTFVVGPMCGINRISSEPPSHPECAEFAARACPFLSVPKMVRRENGLPDDMQEPGGISIKRNPGVALLWFTRSYEIIPMSPTVLFQMGDPVSVAWYCEGRAATREEVIESIRTGLPALREQCDKEETPGRRKEAHAQLELQHLEFMPLLPRRIGSKRRREPYGSTERPIEPTGRADDDKTALAVCPRHVQR